MRGVPKVLVYVTRQRHGERELLVFDHRDHPEAGTQVPSGTVEPGESIEAAARREVREEAGADLAMPAVFLGCFDWLRQDRNERHLRHVYHFEDRGDRPDEWTRTVGGDGEDGGLVFRCYWMPIGDARGRLVAGQGSYLHLL
jgi:8-oxo-dGTP pyrophosphatase MutT (NUDIX family)